MHCLKSVLKEFKKNGHFSILANVHTPNIGERTHFLQTFLANVHTFIFSDWIVLLLLFYTTI